MTFPLSTDAAFPDAAQEIADWLCPKCALLSHVCPAIHHKTQVFWPVSSQPVLMHGSSSRLKTLASAFVKLHEFPVGTFLQADLQLNHQMHHSSVSFANSLGYTVPSFRSLMKMLNSICLSVNPSD